MTKPILFNLTDTELEQFITKLGQPKFRAKQVREWLNRGAPDFSVMKNLPESLRVALDKNATALPLRVVKKLDSSDGQTTKFLLELNDNEFIESVLMRTSYGNSVCVSSQVGCAMGCRFCASTILGLKRNLTTNEMLSQVLIASFYTHDSVGLKDLTHPNGDKNNNDITHIVVMGTGEPLLNFINTIGFLERAHNDLNIGWRRMTISTCGIIPGIKNLIEWGRPINLAISLHATEQCVRSDLMPINLQYNFNDVLDNAFTFSEKTGRQLMIEYILLGGINDSNDDALRLANLLQNKNCMVNLIPWNAVDERDWEIPSGNKIHKFQDILIKNGIHTRIRKERGADIGSACGQLRIKKQSTFC
ncbi:MAG: 23S rRNA (adenine(2503)-C(2))-methyltransferase RlmN [Rickettsiales bacterium]|jgi:23S rRNA (adenine2503-C2)-methyltransferase|nr:23S rRNA (adenine(2503)-C(2))-methyltransferase RlmN [Rickettsiales bacterium]